MDGVMRCYVNDSSTATDDAEADTTTSSPSSSSSTPAAGLRGPRASDVDAGAADASASDGRSSVSTDSNANIVDAVTDVRSTLPCLAPQLNGNVEQRPTADVVEKQTAATSSVPQSSEVLLERRSGGRENHVETKALPSSTAVERCTDEVVERKTVLNGSSECCSVMSASHATLTAAPESSESGPCGYNLPVSLPAAALSRDRAISRLSSSSQTSSVSVDPGQSAIPVDVTRISGAKSGSTSANVNMHTSTSSPSTALLSTQDCSAADVNLATNRAVCDADDTPSSACPTVVPVVSLSCSSLVDRSCSYVPSPGPLTQMYGGRAKDAIQATSSGSAAVSQTSNSSSGSSSVRNSLLALYSPLKVGGDVSEITAKISAARSCTRNGLSLRPSTVAENYSSCERRRADSLRSSLRTADFRSTPWLAAGERFVEKTRRPPSLVLGLAHSASVSGSSLTAADGGCSLVSSSPSSVNSSPSMTPLASRSSSLLSNDSSTLRTNTLVPDNSRTSFHHSS